MHGGNIYLTDTEDKTRGIYLFAPWFGHELGFRLAEALDTHRALWGPDLLDALAGQIVDHVLRSPSSPVRGVSTRLHFNATNRRIWVADLPNRVVALADVGQETQSEHWRHPKSFDTFIVSELEARDAKPIKPGPPYGF